MIGRIGSKRLVDRDLKIQDLYLNLDASLFRFLAQEMGWGAGGVRLEVDDLSYYPTCHVSFPLVENIIFAVVSQFSIFPLSLYLSVTGIFVLHMAYLSLAHAYYRYVYTRTCVYDTYRSTKSWENIEGQQRLCKTFVREWTLGYTFVIHR